MTDPYAGIDGALCRAAENAVLDHVHGTPYTPAVSVYLALSLAFSVVNASYQWTASGSGTAEYFLELADGGDPGIPDPEIMIENGSDMVRGTAGALASGEFDFAENDSQGGKRVYVRLSDDADPDSKADGYLLAGGNPGNDGTGLNEPGDTYTRQAISFSAAASRQVEQAGDVLFPQASTAWGSITHWAVLDAVSGGNVLARGRFPGSSAIGAGIRPKLLSGSVWIKVSPADSSLGYTDFCINSLLNLVFRAGSFSISGVSMALLAAAADDTVEDAAADITEVSGTGYARVSINPAGGAAPAFSAASAGQVDNADAISWGSPGADDWSTVSGVALVTDAGKVLAYDNNISDFTPTTADEVLFEAGDYQAAIH